MPDSENKEGKKSKLTKDTLEKMIAEAVTTTVAESVKTALEPMQHTLNTFGPLILSKKDDPDEKPDGPEEKGIGVARIVRALAFAKGDTERAVYFAKKSWNDKLGDKVEKALAAGDLTAGGFMVPEDMVGDIIDLLRPRSVVRAAGAPVVQMPRGTLTLPKQTGDITASYVGENTDIVKTEPVGGQILLSAKKLAALVPISNDLLDFAPGTAADTFVRNSLVRRIAVREDQAFLRDDGTSGTPRGLRFWALSGQVSNSAGTGSADIEADFATLLQNLEGADVDMSGPVWIMAPRSKNHLITLRDANGNLVFPEMRNARPTVHTLPVFITNNVPTNLNGNESELYLVNMPDTLIGEAGGLEITVDPGASYVEGGTLKSAFSLDQTVIRIILRHDFAVIHQEAVALIDNLTWGA